MEGRLAVWYDREASRNRGFEALAEELAAALPPEGAVLEVAPGPGYLAIELARRGAGRVAGIDISHTFVRIARENAQRAGVQVEFQHGDAARLPYPDGSFDLVVCTAAFKNFTDPAGALDEMHRVLRPGGRARILDMHREAEWSAIREEVDRMGLSWWNGLFTRWVLLYLRNRHAHRLEAIRSMAAASRFRGGDLRAQGIGYDLSLVR